MSFDMAFGVSGTGARSKRSRLRDARRISRGTVFNGQSAQNGRVECASLLSFLRFCWCPLSLSRAAAVVVAAVMEAVMAAAAGVAAMVAHLQLRFPEAAA